MSLSNPIEAEKYIQRHAKGKVKNSSLGIEIEDGKINVDTKKSIHADHMRLAESLTKFINMTPGLNPISKKIMTMKIVNPGYTSTSVAIILGLRKNEVEAYELEGKNRVKDYMRTTDFNDCIKSFEQNGVVERAIKNCFAKDSKIIRQ